MCIIVVGGPYRCVHGQLGLLSKFALGPAVSRQRCRHQIRSIPFPIAASSVSLDNGLPGSTAEEYVDIKGTLPRPPKSDSIAVVVPYLFKVAFNSKSAYWRMALAFSFVLVSKVSGLAAPFFLKGSVDNISQGQEFISMAVRNIFLFAVCRVVSGITNDSQYAIFAPAAMAAGRKVTASVFQHVLDLDIGYHLDQRSGTISTIIERGARSIQFIFRSIAFRFIPILIEIAVVCTIFGKRFGLSVSLVLLVAIVAYVAFTVAIVKLSVGYRSKMIELENKQSGKAVDVFQNIETVTVFNNQSFETHEYNSLLRNYQSASLIYEIAMAVLNSGQNFIISLALAMSLVVTILGAGSGSGVTAGDLVLMQGIILQLWTPLSFFGFFFRETKQALTDMKDFMLVLKTESKMKDGPHDFHKIRKGIKSNGSKGRAGINLSFKNVKFGYKSNRQVIKGIEFDVPAGSSLALVGPSGSGKSTIVSLLVRLYDVNEGSVEYDGVDIRDVTFSSLRSVVGVVPQDTILFNDTIYANILYGNPKATEEEVHKAAKIAQLDAAIRKFPDGYETLVGERGLKLSGGEKQRVAIARTFLRSPELLICDEATASLDTATERDIMDSLKSLAKGRTSVFVAHRLSTIQSCDLIVVMADGIVIEKGTHSELMSRKGMYYSMWQAQVKEETKGEEEFTEMYA